MLPLTVRSASEAHLPLPPSGLGGCAVDSVAL